MKKRFFAYILIALTLVFLGSCTINKASNEGYKLYRSSPIGVEIEYPDFWEVKDSKKERTVAFVTPSLGLADSYRDNVTICAYDLDPKNELAFDEYIRNYVSQLPKQISGYNLISEGEYAVGEYEAYRVVYEGDTDDGALRLSQTFIKHKNTMFIYSLITEPSEFDYFNKNSEVMLTTFKAINK